MALYDPTEFTQPQRSGLHRILSVLLAINIVFHLGSFALVAQWLYATEAMDGAMTPGGLVKVIGIAGLLTLALMVFSFLGLKVAPELHGRTRAAILGVVAGGYLLFAVVSGIGSAVTISRKAGEAAWRAETVAAMQGWAAAAKDATARVDALAPVLDNCIAIGTDLRDREEESGAVSLTGRNAGPTVAELSAITLACKGGATMLLSGRDEAASILLDADRLVGQAARLAADTKLSAQEKAARLDAIGRSMERLSKELGAVLPLAALDAPLAQIAKDRAALGLSPAAVATIAASFRPVSKALSQEWLMVDAELLEAGFERVPLVDGAGLLTRYPAEMAPGAVLAGLVEGVPLLVLGVAALAMPGRPAPRPGPGDPFDPRRAMPRRETIDERS
jgi:hypothetical protein